MGKDGSKKFRDRIRKSAEVHLEGKDGTRKRNNKISESEILAMYYSEQDIERGEKRIAKRIAKNKKEYERQGKKYPEAETSHRNYFYVRIIPEIDGTNYLGITEDDYNNPKCLGYKAKMMISSINLANGDPRQIQVGHHGDYTDEEKRILEQIKRKEENLKGMQETFKDEDSER